MALILNNISKTYERDEVLHQLSLSLEEGQVVGLLGPNGAGKSTLMKIISGYIEATTGSVAIDGQAMSVDATDTKRLIGYLPEHNPLYLDMYVREYLYFIARLYDIKRSERKELINTIIEKTGLNEHADKIIRKLSKGYRQRVGIAAAIIHNPRVLILDEPTTGLDPNQIEEIRQLIKNLSCDRLVIFSTHIMQEVEQICDRVIVLSNGSVVTDDSKVELLQKYGSMENLFRTVTNGR